MENNLRNYVTYFKLIKTANNEYSDTLGRKVLLIMDDKIFIREQENIWKSHNEGNLTLSILNNIPLHC